MLKKKASSYIDTLSTGYESDTVVDYDPATEEAQIGLEHEQEVAQSNNWGNDQRDAIGRAASSKKRRLAKKLRRIAREIEAMEMDQDYQENIEDLADRATDDCCGDDVETAMDDELKSASHPMEHDPEGDDPSANAPSDTGDEWINIGPGTFDDKRDPIGRAASKVSKKK